MIEGYIHPDFWPVARVLQQQLRRAPASGGAAVAVYHRGVLVVDIHGGRRDDETPWSPDTMSVSFSTTKGVMATVVHRLVDRGLLDYDDPVAKVWPEFAQNGKGDITLRHLLCHQAGLYDIRHLIDDARRMLDWQYMVDQLAAAVPAHRPGAMNAYHGLTYGWLVGEVARRVTDRTVSELVQSEIATPLGIDDLHIGVAGAEAAGRVATLVSPRERLARIQKLRNPVKRLQQALSFVSFPVDTGKMAAALAPHGIEHFDWSAPETLRACIPAANGTFSARGLAKLYATLAAGGELDGVRLLSEATLRRATEVQTRKIDKVVPFPMHWRLGYHRAATTRGNPARGFGHYGFGGSGAWADPDRNLAVALVLNSGIGTPFGDIRTAQVGGAALLCARRR